MQWNNILLGLLILYVFLLPLNVSYSRQLNKQNLKNLLLFDIIFVINRSLDLLIGFVDKHGKYEKNVLNVIYKNFSSDFYLELIYAFGPLCFNLEEMDATIYFIFKFPRFNMLFGISHTINKTLEYYCKHWTVYELKKKVHHFNILQFVIQTFNTLHILTCT